MRILYLSQYFPPEMGAASARVHELSREWVKLGHRVEVLTAFTHYPLGVKRPEDRWKISRREELDGIRVIRTYIYAAANRGVVKRMISFASFLLSAAVVGAVRVEKPDVVVATSPQLFCAVAGYLLAKLKRARFVFEVRDLWPESITAVEAMTDNLVVRALKQVAAYLYEHADRIVTVGEGYRRAIHELYGIPLERMDVLPNGFDAGLFVPGPRDNAVRREYGWAGKFVVLYLGTHGMAHALGRVLEAARELQAEPEIRLVLVGEGAEKEALQRQARDWSLPNVEFIGQQPKARVPLFYAACDLGLVTLRATPLFQEVLPSKIFEYLAMERPVLISVDGEARAVVERAGAGEFVPPEDVPALAAAVRRWRDREADLAAMGKTGRTYVLAHHDRRVLAERYLGLLEGIVGREAAR